MKPILVLLFLIVPVQAQDDRYRIGPGDVLDIRVYNRPQLSREAVRVEGNGMIRMPLVENDIQAACLTEGELAKEISTRYARYYKNLQVDVFIKEYHSKQVAVIGAEALQDDDGGARIRPRFDFDRVAGGCLLARPPPLRSAPNRLGVD